MIDAGWQGRFPGLIDAHCHFTGYATDMWKCELFGTKSFGEVVVKLQNMPQNLHSLIYGRGWDQNDWENRQYPDKAILDSLFLTGLFF